MTSRSLTILRAAAWLTLLAVFIITVSPASLRPHIWTANVERFAVFLLCGGLFAAAYPKRWVTIICLIVISAGVFELVQALVPHRHPAIKDFVIKAIGGGIGIAIGILFQLLLDRVGLKCANKRSLDNSINHSG